MSIESVRQRLIASGGPVDGPKSFEVIDRPPDPDRDLLFYAPTDLALLLAVADAAELAYGFLRDIGESIYAEELRGSLDALKAAP